MTAKTMAEVLEELDKHRPDHREYEGGWWELACAGCDFAKGERLSHLDWAPYRTHRAEVFAAALSAAGFGLVADAKAEALEEAADGFARAGNNVRNSTYVESGIYHDLVQQARGLESAAETLRAQAAKIRAVS